MFRLGQALPATAALLAVLLTAGFAAGCRGPQPTSAPALPAQDDNAGLLEYINDQPFITAEPGFRAVYILWRGVPFEGDFTALTAALESERIVDPLWNLAPDARLDRATVGVLVCRACGIRSGLNWFITGMGRYAYRELVYHEIAQPAGELAYVPGGEFVGILQRAEKWMTARGRPLERNVELGDQPAP